MTESTEAATVDGVNVDAVAAAARGCPGVSDLAGGRFGDVTSYLPGRRVPGVAVDATTVTVQVRARWGVRAADLLGQVTAAVTPHVAGRSTQVVVDDIDDSPAIATAPAPPEPARRSAAPRPNSPAAVKPTAAPSATF